jgi:hypothetical protein
VGTTSSISGAPVALAVANLNGFRSMWFRGSALIREMVSLDSGPSIRGLPLSNSERTVSMLVRYVESNGLSACGLAKNPADAHPSAGGYNSARVSVVSVTGRSASGTSDSA